MQINRLDPVNEVEFVLETYSGTALHLFRMWLRRALESPESRFEGRLGSIEKAVQRVQRKLRDHPEAEAKRAAIRLLLENGQGSSLVCSSESRPEPDAARTGSGEPRPT